MAEAQTRVPVMAAERRPGQVSPEERRGRQLSREGRRRQLSREEIARVALELGDREGLEAVTIRRLAAEIGMSPMGLYRYFRSKEELYDACVEVATEGTRLELPASGWQDQLRAVAGILRRGLERHPSAVQLRLRRPLLTPGALRITEAGIGVLRRAGFDRVEAVRAYRVVFLQAFAFAAFNSPPDADVARRQAWGAMATLPPEEFPEITAAASEAAEIMSGDERQFEFAVDLLIEALEARLERKTS